MGLGYRLSRCVLKGANVLRPCLELLMVAGRRTHLLYFTYSYCILSRVWILATSLLILRHYEKSISVFYVNTARHFVTVLLIFAKYLSLYLHIFTLTYRGTHTQEHMYNRHTRRMATTRHKSLFEGGGRKAFVRDKGLAHTKKKCQKKCQKNPIWTNLKRRIRAHRTSSKATKLFPSLTK